VANGFKLRLAKRPKCECRTDLSTTCSRPGQVGRGQRNPRRMDVCGQSPQIRGLWVSGFPRRQKRICSRGQPHYTTGKSASTHLLPTPSVATRNVTSTAPSLLRLAAVFVYLAAAFYASLASGWPHTEATSSPSISKPLFEVRSLRSSLFLITLHPCILPGMWRCLDTAGGLRDLRCQGSNPPQGFRSHPHIFEQPFDQSCLVSCLKPS
jgi:hypothetical protein